IIVTKTELYQRLKTKKQLESVLIVDEKDIPTVDHGVLYIVLSTLRGQLCAQKEYIFLKKPVKLLKLMEALNQRHPKFISQSPVISAFEEWHKGKDITVLIVEDNTIIQKSLSKLLNKYNLKTVCASNGLEALNIIEKGDIH